MAALDVAGAIANVKTMLSGLAAWQTICGVTTTAEAAKRIHLGAIEDTGEESPCPCILLDIDPFNSDWMPSTAHGRLTVEIRTELAIPETERETYAAMYLWAWTQVSALLAGINGAVNGPGGLMIRSLTLPVPPGPINPDDNQGRIEWGCIITLGIEFI